MLKVVISFDALQHKRIPSWGPGRDFAQFYTLSSHRHVLKIHPELSTVENKATK